MYRVHFPVNMLHYVLLGGILKGTGANLNLDTVGVLSSFRGRSQRGGKQSLPQAMKAQNAHF